MTNKEKDKLQKEVLDSIVEDESGRLILPPRTGKTALVIKLIKRDKPKSILWVTPSLELAEKDIPKEFIKWKAKGYLKNLTAVTWMSLDKIRGHYDLIILDEEQFITLNNAENLINGSLSGRIISMTGTASKHQQKNLIYQHLKLNTIYDMSLNEAVDIGLLAKYSINVIDVDLNTEDNIKVAMKNGKSFITSEYKQYQYYDRRCEQGIVRGSRTLKFDILKRMRLVYDSPSKHKMAETLISSLSGRKLIFCGSIKQAESLCKHTYHSKTDNKDLQKFIKGEIDEISMVNAGGTGFTYKEVDHMILVQADSDKNGSTSQKISRVLLAQPNYKAKIWILRLKGTQDEKWINSTLERFDISKIVQYNDALKLNMFKKHGVNTIIMGSRKVKV